MCEVLLYAGVVYGFGFVQYILELEGVFWNELCYDPNNPEHNSACTINAKEQVSCPEELTKNPCPESQAEFNSIYTWFLLSSSLTVLMLDPILNRFGIFCCRFICALFTTAGLVCLCLYETNPYLLWGAWQLMGVSATMYIIMNIKEQCALFPKLTGITLGLINGFFDASAGVFLAFKFIYDAGLPNITVPQMFAYYSMGVSLIWVKLFFFCPRYDVKKTENYTILADSFVGSFCKKTKIESVEKEAEEVMPVTWQEYKKSLFSLNFVLFNIFSIITTLRISSIPIWILPWLKWTFQDFPEDEAADLVSKNMDIYGIMFYASMIICPIPGMILKAIEKFICKEKLRAEYYGLIWFCFFTALLCAVLSFQMCIIGSEFNATFLVIEFSFLRTIYFISRSMYLFQQFPAEHFGLLYGICIFCLAGTQYSIEPMFKLIQGSDGVMDFVPVSFALGIASAACVFLPIYNIIVAKRFLREHETKSSPRDSTISKKDEFCDEL